MSDGNTRRVAIKLSTEDDDEYYVFDINPKSFVNNDSTDMALSRTIDGYAFENIRNFDGRVLSMKWGPLPNKAPYSTLLAALKTYKGKECNIKYNYLEGTGEQNTTARSIRVIDVVTEFREGLGPKDSTSYLIYENIELLFVYI